MIQMIRLTSREVSAPQIWHLFFRSCFNEFFYDHEYVFASWSEQTVWRLKSPVLETPTTSLGG
jgi:hypothetical protein